MLYESHKLITEYYKNLLFLTCLFDQCNQHDNIKERLDEKNTEINDSLEAFTNEMKDQGSWDDITIVVASEFARTMAGKIYNCSPQKDKHSKLYSIFFNYN